MVSGVSATGRGPDELADRVPNDPVRKGVVVALSRAVPEPVKLPSIAAMIATNHGFGRLSFTVITRVIQFDEHVNATSLYILQSGPNHLRHQTC